VEILEQFFAKFNSVHFYKKGEIILRADENPPGVFFLKKGFIRLYSISPEGQEITFNVFKPDSFFSMMWAIGGSANAYFFEAMTAVEVWRAPKNKFLEFIKKEPEVLFDLTRRVLLGLNGLLTEIEYLLFGNANNKVASILFILAKRFGQKKNNGDITVQLPLTHKNIASLVGLTRETASLEIKKLENEKIITHRKRLLVIKNLKRLKKELLISTRQQPSVNIL